MKLKPNQSKPLNLTYVGKLVIRDSFSATPLVSQLLKQIGCIPSFCSPLLLLLRILDSGKVNSERRKSCVFCSILQYLQGSSRGSLRFMK